jgi:hypothetical protein
MERNSSKPRIKNAESQIPNEVRDKLDCCKMLKLMSWYVEKPMEYKGQYITLTYEGEKA